MLASVVCRVSPICPGRKAKSGEPLLLAVLNTRHRHSTAVPTSNSRSLHHVASCTSFPFRLSPLRPPGHTSLEVAKFFGKRHDHVLRDVDVLLSQLPENSLQPNWGETYQEQETPLGVKQVRMFILYRDGFMLLVMGYTGKKALAMKLAYIEAFNRMEQDWTRREAGLRQEFMVMLRELDARRGDLFSHAVSDLGRNADTMFSTQCLLDSLFQSRTEAEQRFHQALDDASLHLRLSLNVAVALGR